jgi:hypothetical protein
MALKPLTPAINSRPPLPGAPSVPYKRRAPPPEFTAPLPASLRFSPRSSLPLTERRRLPVLHTIAWHPQRCLSSGETRAEFSSLPSPFCAPTGELWRTGAAGGQALVSAPPCPLSAPASVHGGPSTPGRSTETWTRSTDLSVGQ